MTSISNDSPIMDRYFHRIHIFVRVSIDITVAIHSGVSEIRKGTNRRERALGHYFLQIVQKNYSGIALGFSSC